MRTLTTLARAAAVIAAAAALALPAAAANAHDVLESTNPANGSTVAAVPAAVELTFDHTPIAIGTKVVVKDPSGTDVASGEARVVDNTVTQAIKPGAPAGAYTVTWRVVSSDSHPIEGTFTFTAKAPRGGAADGGATAGVAPPSSAPAAGSSDSDHEAVGAGVPWWVIAGGAAVVLAIAALALIVRRALSRAQPED
ncbi:copper resistance protein CopC [Sinomonas sp. ASV322]|uniref:copper resistance CopC family protein n=1 Tax=Sinomonas sp. ASV322 TaxID=3041920 RepID=UPI0027DD2766|nr:copper resistance protein CopC [Sinomonas sp. ASV322]MDQ4503941.1 copper resistance protein CopC [Sinomonas sp. ASV322]